MRIEYIIDKVTREKLNRIRNDRKEDNKHKKKHQDNLSHKELEVLMGVNRPRYKRCRGAYRQR